jgi:hypothetical protein
MSELSRRPDDETIVTEVIHSQLEHFRKSQPPCRGMQLPDGVLLRHTLSRSLYYYLRTAVENGRIKTHVFASDSPYELQKASIGVVSTGMFEPRADHVHLEKLEDLIREWAAFVREAPDAAQDFQSFRIDQ